jgi:hypothetical protein
MKAPEDKTTSDNPQQQALRAVQEREQERQQQKREPSSRGRWTEKENNEGTKK